MKYTYKTYPQSKTATILSGAGTGMLVMCAAVIIYWLVYNISDVISGTVNWYDSAKYFITAAVFGAFGVMLLLAAHLVGKRAGNKLIKTGKSYLNTKKQPIAKEGSQKERLYEDEYFTSGQDAEKYIKQQLKLKTSYKIIFIIAACIMIFGGVKGYSVKYNDTADAVQFNNMFVNNRPYYSDIVMLSDVICKVDVETFYYARDDAAQFIIVRLSKDDFNDCKLQYNFYLNNCEGDKPFPKRLYGSAKIPSTELEKSIIKSLGITKEEYSRNFGFSYFDATATPVQEETNQWRSVFWWMVLFLSVFGFEQAKHIIIRTKSIKQLNDRQMSISAANDLNKLGGLTFKEPDTVKSSDNFIYSKSTGRIVAIADILWYYTYSYGGTETLMIGTKSLNRKPFGTFKAGSGATRQITYSINRCNPSALYGCTRENLKKFRELRKQQ